jgi:hypothetical protein
MVSTDTKSHSNIKTYVDWDRVSESDSDYTNNIKLTLGLSSWSCRRHLSWSWSHHVIIVCHRVVEHMMDWLGKLKKASRQEELTFC